MAQYVPQHVPQHVQYGNGTKYNVDGWRTRSPDSPETTSLSAQIYKCVKNVFKAEIDLFNLSSSRRFGECTKHLKKFPNKWTADKMPLFIHNILFKYHTDDSIPQRPLSLKEKICDGILRIPDMVLSVPAISILVFLKQTKETFKSLMNLLPNAVSVEAQTTLPNRIKHIFAKVFSFICCISIIPALSLIRAAITASITLICMSLINLVIYPLVEIGIKITSICKYLISSKKTAGLGEVHNLERSDSFNSDDGI